MSELILKEMRERNADGVDFVPLGFGLLSRLIQSNTRQEFENGEVEYYPRSARKYWQIVDGKKVYV